MAGVSASAEPASNPKIDRALLQSIREGGATQHVIISVKPGYRAEIRQALEKHGDRIKAEHPLIDALAADVHRDDVKELANHPWVLALSSDATVSAGAVSTPPIGTTPDSTLSMRSAVTSTLRETLGLARVATSTSLTGSTGIGVAIIDSGIAPNQDFKGRITGFYDFTRGGIPTEPFDDYGHGTHIAALVGSSGIQSNYDLQGIAPSVHLIGLKVLDGTGQGSTSNVIKALEYVTANHAHLNVQIVNLSLGHPIFAPAKDDPLVQAVERAAASGLIVVASAGNFGEKASNGQSGYTGITSPGNAPSAITVGAAQTQNTITRDDDSVATFSSRGPTWYDGYAKPNVVAPGRQLPADTTVTSYLYKLLTGDRVTANNGQPLLRLSGTSMAAGVTSGVVALILDAHNRSGYHRQTALTPNLVKAILEFSAISVAGADSLTQGAGSINAAGAISLASGINTADALNAYWLHTSVPGFNMIGTQQVAWGQNIVWGDTVLTGDLLYTNNIVWGDNIVWGTRVLWGSDALVRAANIVWGTDNVWGANLVWGDRVIGEHDGDNIVWGTLGGDNIVWGTLDGDNIVWGTCDGDNIVWGTADGDNIVWGTSSGDNIVWGSSREDGDNIVWGSSVLKGGTF